MKVNAFAPVAIFVKKLILEGNFVYMYMELTFTNLLLITQILRSIRCVTINETLG